jgi:hypothetical protein
VSHRGLSCPLFCYLEIGPPSGRKEVKPISGAETISIALMALDLTVPLSLSQSSGMHPSPYSHTHWQPPPVSDSKHYAAAPAHDSYQGMPTSQNHGMVPMEGRWYGAPSSSHNSARPPSHHPPASSSGEAAKPNGYTQTRPPPVYGGRAHSPYQAAVNTAGSAATSHYVPYYHHYSAQQGHSDRRRSLLTDSVPVPAPGSQTTSVRSTSPKAPLQNHGSQDEMDRMTGLHKRPLQNVRKAPNDSYQHANVLASDARAPSIGSAESIDQTSADTGADTEVPEYSSSKLRRSLSRSSSGSSVRGSQRSGMGSPGKEYSNEPKFHSKHDLESMTKEQLLQYQRVRSRASSAKYRRKKQVEIVKLRSEYDGMREELRSLKEYSRKLEAENRKLRETLKP